MNSPVGDGLPAHVWGFAKLLAKLIQEQHAAGLVQKSLRIYIKPVVSDFFNTEQRQQISQSISQTAREELHWSEQTKFLEQVVKPLPEFSRLAEEIVKTYAQPRPQVEVWLTSLTQTILSKALEGLSDGAIADCVSLFIADLEGAAIEWNYKFWLNGVFLDGAPFDFTPNVKLRAAVASDYEDEVVLDEGIYWTGVNVPHVRGSAVLEAAIKTRDPFEAQKVVNAVTQTLRLQDIGSVYQTASTSKARSFLHTGLTSTLSFGAVQAFRYTLRGSETTRLGSLYEAVSRLLGSEGTPSDSALSIALQRYNDAVLQSMSNEGRVAMAISCLEALLLKGPERSELAHRLAQRASLLLELLGSREPILKTYQALGRAYDVRSTFIHGSRTEARPSPEESKEIINYARRSLVAFIGLPMAQEKDAFIAKLDNALLDANARKKLQEQLNSSDGTSKA